MTIALFSWLTHHCGIAESKTEAYAGICRASPAFSAAAHLAAHILA